MYYKYNNNFDGIISKSATDFKDSICSMLDIPVENAKIINGELFDNRSLECAKLIKINELNVYNANISKAPYMTTINVKANVDEKALMYQTMGDSLSNLNGAGKTVDFIDYDGNVVSLSQADYKKLCKETGNRINDLRKAYYTILKQIDQASTVEQVQAIVITGK